MSEVIVRIPVPHAREVAKAMRDGASFFYRGAPEARHLRETAQQIEQTLTAWKLPTGYGTESRDEADPLERYSG